MIEDEKIIEMFFERSEQGIRELDKSLWNKGRTYTPLRACALCRGLISVQEDFPALRLAALPQQGAAPLPMCWTNPGCPSVCNRP